MKKAKPPKGGGAKPKGLKSKGHDSRVAIMKVVMKRAKHSKGCGAKPKGLSSSFEYDSRVAIMSTKCTIHNGIFYTQKRTIPSVLVKKCGFGNAEQANAKRKSN